MAYDFWAELAAGQLNQNPNLVSGSNRNSPSRSHSPRIPHTQEGHRSGRHAAPNSELGDPTPSPTKKKTKPATQNPASDFHSPPSADSALQTPDIIDPTTRRLLNHWDQECRERWQKSAANDPQNQDRQSDSCPDIWGAIKDQLED